MEFKNPLSVRGDYMYCPLCFSLDSYWWCEYDCPVCYLRGLNEVWGTEQRIADPGRVESLLTGRRKGGNPLVNKMIKLKKALRFGNKTDPFQRDTERQHRVSKALLELLSRLDWSVVLQTKTTEVVLEYLDILTSWLSRDKVVVMPVISPGGDRDWEVLEGGGPTSPTQRLEDLKVLQSHGVRVGVNGEPFIPGYHTIQEFEDTIKLLKSFGIQSYNTYHLHLTPHTAKRLAEVGLDMERVWYENQDDRWRRVLTRLIEIAQKYDIELGCPDFVNSGRYTGRANTCCGIDVDNPCRFNVHHFKLLYLKGVSPDDILKHCWEGYGDLELGRRVLTGDPKGEIYTMRDIVLEERREVKRGRLF